MFLRRYFKSFVLIVVRYWAQIVVDNAFLIMAAMFLLVL